MRQPTHLPPLVSQYGVSPEHGPPHGPRSTGFAISAMGTLESLMVLTRTTRPASQPANAHELSTSKPPRKYRVMSAPVPNAVSWRPRPSRVNEGRGLVPVNCS